MQERMRRMMEFRDKIRMHNGTINVEDRNITIRELSEDRKEIIAGKINARTGLNLTSDDIGNGTLGSILSAYLSNGRKAEIKFLPDRASKIALARLRAKCADDNCSVELKEVGTGNKTRIAYVVETTKDSSVFWIFKNKMVVKAQVDAETGEIISIQKPWWAFLAKEKDEAEDENGNADISSCTIDTECNAGFSCYNVTPRGPITGIKGSIENPGLCYNSTIIATIV